MAVRMESAARHLCELSGWTLSNLALQKMLYLSQVEYAAISGGEALIEDRFQAWDYGPVVPRLYRKLKMFGANSVDDVFYNAKTIRAGTLSDRAIEATWDCFGGVEPGELIEVSHWEHGGWSKRYQPGIREIEIKQTDITREAENRKKYSDEWERVIAT